MEGPRFDDLTRSLARRSARRALLRAFGGGGAAALAALRPGARAGAAPCVAGGKRCEPAGKRPCCSGKCCAGVCCQDDLVEPPGPPFAVPPVEVPPGSLPPLDPPAGVPPAEDPGPPFEPPPVEVPPGVLPLRCPPGTACSGTVGVGIIVGDPAVCDIPFNTCECAAQFEYNTADLCCSWPAVAMACSNSAPGANDGFAICCIPSVDCPAPTGACARGGIGGCCTEPNRTFPECCTAGCEGGCATGLTEF